MFLVKSVSYVFTFSGSRQHQALFHERNSVLSSVSLFSLVTLLVAITTGTLLEACHPGEKVCRLSAQGLWVCVCVCISFC